MKKLVSFLLFLSLISCTNAIPEITPLSPIKAPEAISTEQSNSWKVDGKCSFSSSSIMFSTDEGQRWFTPDGLGEDVDCGDNRSFSFSIAKGFISLQLKEIVGKWESEKSNLILIESLTLDDENIIYPEPQEEPVEPDPVTPPTSPSEPPAPVAPPVTPSPTPNPTPPSQPTDFVKGHEKVKTSGGITITSVDELRDFFVIKLTVSGMTQYRYYFSMSPCSVSDEYMFAGDYYNSGTNLVVEKSEVMPNLCVSGYTILLPTPLKFGSFIWNDLID